VWPIGCPTANWKPRVPDRHRSSKGATYISQYSYLVMNRSKVPELKSRDFLDECRVSHSILHDVQGIRSSIATKNIEHPTRTDKLFRSDRCERYHSGANKTLELQSLDLRSADKPTSFRSDLQIMDC
jgi:hypothetical protein